MFEREIRDTAFIKRWSIVRTLRDQSVAEHSYMVTMYANDICVILGLSPEVQLAALKHALWHDVDEVFTGDLPGPNKRALLGEAARASWDRQLLDWSVRTFNRWLERAAYSISPRDAATVKLVVKLADWMDAAMEMATEVQFGNTNCKSHVTSQMRKALEAVQDLGKHLGIKMDDVPFATEEGSMESRAWDLYHLVQQVIPMAQLGESKGPHVADASL